MVIIAIYLSMVKKLLILKSKDSEIVPHPLCIGGISKDFPSQMTNNVGLIRYIYDYSVDYWAIVNDKMMDIHKYQMKMNKII